MAVYAASLASPTTSWAVTRLLKGSSWNTAACRANVVIPSDIDFDSNCGSGARYRNCSCKQADRSL